MDTFIKGTTVLYSSDKELAKDRPGFLKRNNNSLMNTDNLELEASFEPKRISVFSGLVAKANKTFGRIGNCYEVSLQKTSHSPQIDSQISKLTNTRQNYEGIVSDNNSKFCKLLRSDSIFGCSSKNSQDELEYQTLKKAETVREDNITPARIFLTRKGTEKNGSQETSKKPKFRLRLNRRANRLMGTKFRKRYQSAYFEATDFFDTDEINSNGNISSKRTSPKRSHSIDSAFAWALAPVMSMTPVAMDLKYHSPQRRYSHKPVCNTEYSRRVSNYGNELCRPSTSQETRNDSCKSLTEVQKRSPSPPPAATGMHNIMMLNRQLFDRMVHVGSRPPKPSELRAMAERKSKEKFECKAGCECGCKCGCCHHHDNKQGSCSCSCGCCHHHDNKKSSCSCGCGCCHHHHHHHHDNDHSSECSCNCGCCHHREVDDRTKDKCKCCRHDIITEDEKSNKPKCNCDHCRQNSFSPFAEQRQWLTILPRNLFISEHQKRANQMKQQCENIKRENSIKAAARNEIEIPKHVEESESKFEISDKNILNEERKFTLAVKNEMYTSGASSYYKPPNLRTECIPRMTTDLTRTSQNSSLKKLNRRSISMNSTKRLRAGPRRRRHRTLEENLLDESTDFSNSCNHKTRISSRKMREPSFTTKKREVEIKKCSEEELCDHVEIEDILGEKMIENFKKVLFQAELEERIQSEERKKNEEVETRLIGRQCDFYEKSAKNEHNNNNKTNWMHKPSYSVISNPEQKDYECAVDYMKIGANKFKGHNVVVEEHQSASLPPAPPADKNEDCTSAQLDDEEMITESLAPSIPPSPQPVSVNKAQNQRPTMPSIRIDPEKAAIMISRKLQLDPRLSIMAKLMAGTMLCTSLKSDQGSSGMFEERDTLSSTGAEIKDDYEDDLRELMNLTKLPKSAPKSEPLYEKPLPTAARVMRWEKWLEEKERIDEFQHSRPPGLQQTGTISRNSTKSRNPELGYNQATRCHSPYRTLGPHKYEVPSEHEAVTMASRVPQLNATQVLDGLNDEASSSLECLNPGILKKDEIPFNDILETEEKNSYGIDTHEFRRLTRPLNKKSTLFSQVLRSATSLSFSDLPSAISFEECTDCNVQNFQSNTEPQPAGFMTLEEHFEKNFGHLIKESKLTNRNRFDSEPNLNNYHSYEQKFVLDYSHSHNNNSHVCCDCGCVPQEQHFEPKTLPMVNQNINCYYMQPLFPSPSPNCAPVGFINGIVPPIHNRGVFEINHQCNMLHQVPDFLAGLEPIYIPSMQKLPNRMSYFPNVINSNNACIVDEVEESSEEKLRRERLR